MKHLLKLFVITFLFIQTGFSQNKVLDSFEINPDELSKEYVFSNKISCQSIQAATFYNSPELYSFILGETLEKRFQTVKYKGKKGSILYFEFDEKAKDGEAFIQGLLLGGKKPNKKHPEEIITKGNVMIVLSFPFKSDIRKEMIELMKKK